jgi:hypothetical protein
MLSEQRGASVLTAARLYGLPHHAMRRLIREGRITPRAVGRRSIVILSELEEVLKTFPPTKSSRPSAQTEGVPHAA